MLTAHHVNAFLVIAVCAVSAVAALIAYRRRGSAGRVVAQLLALAQTVLIAQVAMGLLLLGDRVVAIGEEREGQPVLLLELDVRGLAVR